MRFFDLIAKKRDNLSLTHEEMEYFIRGASDGSIPDYQLSAMLMAMYIRGLNKQETVDMTQLMAGSGDRIDLSGIEGMIVDKHSTGGVGDKTTLVTCPIMAACGLKVAKMSGRGLGHTGGTVDKLESIPGFRTKLSPDEFKEAVRTAGIAVASASADIAPADKKLYALRDVTATIDNIPLIACSIMSKKLASGAKKIVLDVKTGSGAFMKDFDKALELASTMVEIAIGAGVEAAAVVTDMDIPLGLAVGNSLEVIEAIDTLKGQGPADLAAVGTELAVIALMLGGKGSYDRCRKLADDALKSGAALDALTAMIKAQGGDVRVVERYDILPAAKYSHEVRYGGTSGYISHMDTTGIGNAANALGAGRTKLNDPVDHAAGITLVMKTGDAVKPGDVIAVIRTDDQARLDAAEKMISAAYDVAAERPRMRPIVMARVHSDLTTENFYEKRV